MKKEIILFDLDGTLTDPMEGITKSVQYALRHYGIEEPDLKKLTPFIGPPLRDSFMKYYGFSKEQADEAVWVYREYFADKGIFENQELPGIRAMLEGLKAAGKQLYVATSKPEVYARQILEHFHLDEYFAFVGGADMGETRVKKGDVIRYVLDEAGVGGRKTAAVENVGAETARTETSGTTNAGMEMADAGNVGMGITGAEVPMESIVMVGDREHDILGAKENGISSVGLLLGYGSREELLEAGADRIAADAEELAEILLGEWEG